MKELLNNEQLTTAIDAINKAIKVEKIYLLGSKGERKYSENIFRKTLYPSYNVTEFQFLLLTPIDETRDYLSIQEIIDVKCPLVTRLNVIPIRIDTFNTWLIKGHLLANTVINQECWLVYDSKKTELVNSGTYDIGKIREDVKADYIGWYSRAMDCVTGADGYKLRKKYNMATFLLHQATELTLMATIKLVTGYRAGTHSLDKLFRLAIAFGGETMNVFPKDSDKEIKLFRNFQKSYIGSRYDLEYSIEENDYLLVKERVEKLMAASNTLRLELKSELTKPLKEPKNVI